MTDPILPTAAQILTPAIDAIVAARPRAVRFFNTGVGNWPNLLAGWRAQIQLNLVRLADEVKSARIATSTGAPLRALCASEFATTLPSEPQPSLATVTLRRPAPVSGTAPAGIIRKGDIFTKLANPGAQPLAVAAAQYRVVQTVYVPAGQLTAPTVLLVASAPSADGNVPEFLFTTSTIIQPAKPLFDPSFKVIACDAAGGSSGLTEPVLRSAALAFAVGQFGPTDGAIVAGLLRQQSVRHIAAFRASSTLPYAQVYIADESWASSAYWTSAAAQTFITGFQGFGCRTRFGVVVNQQVAVSATIALKSTDDLNNTDEIDGAVRKAARAYFDDRPDWYRWRATALQAALSRADRRISHCVSVAITNPSDGTPIGDPENLFGLVWAPTILHPYLADNAVTATYVPPS